MRFSRKLLLSGVVIASVALLVPISEPLPQTSPALAKALSKGRALMKEGKYEAAIKRLKKAGRLKTV